MKESWEKLDQRKIPEWFQRAKFGIFIHCENFHKSRIFILILEFFFMNYNFPIHSKIPFSYILDIHWIWNSEINSFIESDLFFFHKS